MNDRPNVHFLKTPLACYMDINRKTDFIACSPGAW